MSISFVLVTRPELSVGVSVLSTRSQNPSLRDFKYLQKILKYLNLTKHICMTLKPKNLKLYCYVDSSYLVHHDAKSHNGFCISMGEIEENWGAVLYCKSNKSKVVCKSSTEAELVGIDTSLSDIIFLTKCCEEMDIKIGQTTLFNDNMSTIKIIENETLNSKIAKHISMRYYFVREKIKDGTLCIKYKNTNDLVADTLTKPLSNPKFCQFAKLLLCCSINIDFFKVNDN